MNLKTSTLRWSVPTLALLVVLLGMTAYGRAATPALPASGQEPPLRIAEPVEAIAADLEHYIPEYMHEQNVPGVAIALIHDGKVVWTEGFGVANTITRKPATPEMLFEVASNSKVVTAYIALRLVDQGRLSLDEPLNAYLPEPWLPPSEYRDAITLRHVLSHSAGLGHNTLERESLFAPGQGYSYSAIGFLYVQEVIEQVTGQPLEDVAQEMVFEPLGMSSSSFVNRAEFLPRTVNGHLRAGVPVLLFVVPFAVCFVILGLVGLLILRIRTGRWRPTLRMVVGVYAVAFILPCLAAFVLLGKAGLLEFAWLIALCGLVLAVALALVLFAGRFMILRLRSGQALRLSPERPGKWIALAAVLGVLLVAALTCSQAKANLPVPRWPVAPADAAGSLRATAGDLATFLIELSNPQYLSAETAAQLKASQVRLSRDLSWGLGPGIQHSQQGDALWQWGQHLDFQSVMIIYPEHGFGVVVCTNSDLLNPDVAIAIAHRAIGGQIEPLRRATHLEFNYRDPDVGQSKQ